MEKGQAHWHFFQILRFFWQILQVTSAPLVHFSHNYYFNYQHCQISSVYKRRYKTFSTSRCCLPPPGYHPGAFPRVRSASYILGTARRRTNRKENKREREREENLRFWSFSPVCFFFWSSPPWWGFEGSIHTFSPEDLQ